MGLGLCTGLGGLELALRFCFPSMVIGAGAHMQFKAGARSDFQTDSEAGYMPVLGTSSYDRFGCRVDRYDQQGQRAPDNDGNHRDGRRRVLFVGDSVTRRGHIQQALQKIYGEQRYEYWNAGVESFNTAQELIFYRRFNANLKPDQVILTFHNNDFEDTPLVYAENGQLQIHFMRRDGNHINPWMFSHSYLYRWLTGLSLGMIDRQRQRAQVAEALQGFKSTLSEQKVDFSVVLLPILKPPAQWTNRENWSRQNALAILAQEQITTYDLLADMERALSEGISLQESPGDAWHPSIPASQHFARYLAEQKILP
ncbi:MAG: hypothetical protein U0931_34530 [Vulcanimicrobiota bacterium]